MNRKKKINQTLKSKLKKMNAKLQNSSKPKYISKAERANIAAKEAEANLAEDLDERITETITESNTDSISNSEIK
ncbi:MAG: putative Holliday junction resolvase-like endonuclease [Cognaticolwellia sp.]|jgi:predicted Holliday junction resolvase-like endonuclease